MEYLLLGLLAIGIPIAWTAAFFMALGARTRLLALEAKLSVVERRVALAGSGPAAAAAPGATVPPPEEDGPVADDPVRRRQEPQAPPPEADAATPPEASGQAPEPEPPSGPALPPEPADAASEPPRRPGLDVFAPQPAPAGSQAAAGPGLEERLGTRWVVWVGGIALALGAVFLVRYSIEQGLIGPGMRIFLGLLLAAALIAAGEWTRRQEATSGTMGLPQASVPAILTAAGTVAAFATVWAAHGLYAFIGAGTAFVALGAVALATLAAALLHGPALAGLGLVGAYVAPLLVSSTTPSFWALYLYLAVVTAAAFALARMRLWRWLAITAVAASALWVLPGLGYAFFEPAPHAVYLGVAFALAAGMIVAGLLFGPEGEPDTVDGVSSAALAAYLAAAALVTLASDHQPVPLLTFAALAGATVAIAWRAPAATAAVPAAAFITALVVAEWALQFQWDSPLAAPGPVTGDVPEPIGAFTGTHMAVGAGLAALFGIAGFLAQGRSEKPLVPILWAAGAIVAPVAILVALYARIAFFEQSIPFAGMALLLAALYATATELLSKRPARPGMASAAALFAVGAVAALALALTMALERGWLTVALALMAPGIAMIADKRPLPFLRWLAASVAVLVALRVGWEPRIVSDVGTTPVFNWLLWGYGVPAAAFWTAGHLLRRRGDDVPARMLDAAAILFTVLALALQIRHVVTGGDLYDDTPRLAEFGLQTSALLAMAIGLEWIRGRSRSPVHDIGALIVAAMALGVAVIGLVFAGNPLLTDEWVGGPFFNTLLIGYGIPAVLAITLALVAMETRPMAYRAVAAATSVTLALAYLTLQARRLFQGPELGIYHGISDAEWWSYSAIWLAFGVLLLLVGIAIRSQPARLASGIVIFLTVLKVFLLDLAGIGGIWRALSFIGLGVVLMAIGWLYQRLLFPPRPPAAPPAPEAAPAGGTGP